MTYLRTILCLAMAGAFACNSATEGGEACGEPPYFTVLPVAVSDFNLITVIGGFGAPVHTLPTPHAGFMLARPGVTVRAPGPIEVTRLRRVTYQVSPTRQGLSDYAVEYRVCRDVTGWFGHVSTLSTSFPSDLQWRNCTTYSTSDETVQTCEASPDVRLEAGEAIGTGGLTNNILGLDVGLLDARVNNQFITPQRYHREFFEAICAWEQFDAAAQAMLFAKLFDPIRPATPALGTPRCGTMEVDVAGTAKGVWAQQGVTGPLGGDERPYVTLADYPYRPQQNLVLSLGPATLGASVAIVARQTTGRVNLAFEQVPATGTIHCYGPALAPANQSWFIALSSTGALSIERVPHAIGATPCLSDPSTWSFGGARVTMVR